MDNAKYLEVDAGVRYWDDGFLNGEPDIDAKMPLRKGDRWQPVINLDSGAVLGWPKGLAALVHYKVCDDGEYWLLDSLKCRIAKWKDYYVPNNLLCLDGDGFGDYIILSIEKTGVVSNWKRPTLMEENWERE